MPARPPIYRFGPFEFEPAAGQLRKFGHKLKVRGIPLMVLEALLEAQGHVVTREELQKKIWPADTFVDFEHGLNTAVAKLRQALSDSATDPRFIETLERRGYRFLAAVEVEVQPRAMAAAAPAGDSSIVVPNEPVTAAPHVEPAAPELLPPPTHRRYRSGAVVIAAVLLCSIGLSYYLWQRAHQRTRDLHEIRSLAVLPFKNLSGDATQDTLADGMTDGIITSLAQIGSLRVISATSTLSYKNSPKRLPEIAGELNVDGIVEGTVLRSGNSIRISVQLIDGRSDVHLWAGEYERDSHDVLPMQSEVARAVAKELRILLSADEQTRLSGTRRVVPAAHEAYVKGRSHWYRRWLGGANELSTGGEYFAEAVRLDPNYASGYSGLADFYAFQAIYGLKPPAQVWPQAEDAIARALQLDPNLAEAHISHAQSRLYWHWDLEGADRASLRAIQLNPNYSEAHSFRATLLSVLGRYDESIAAARRAEDLDPVGQLGRTLLAYSRAGRSQELESAAKAALAKHPGLAYGFLASAYLAQLRFQEWLDYRLKSFEVSNDTERIAVYRAAFAKGGFPAVMKWELKKSTDKAKKSYVSPFDLASAYARAGEAEPAFQQLEKAFQEHSDRMVFLHVDPAFDSIRDDKRFIAMMDRIGIPHPPR